MGRPSRFSPLVTGAGALFLSALLLGICAAVAPLSPALHAQDLGQDLATLEAALTGTATVSETVTETATTTATAAITATLVPVTPTLEATPTATSTPSPTPSPTLTPTLPPTPTPTAGPPLVDLSETEVLTGTIVANRTTVPVTFFLDGKLYELPPRRSTGAVLRRAVGVLTLFNCEAGTEESTDACFWDPYPIRQDGFYEIVNSAEEGAAVTLMLQEAVPPPANQVWIQNRTGHPERFLYGSGVYDLPNSTVMELSIDTDAGQDATTFHLRHCLTLNDETVCEWLPQPVMGGIYYALVEKATPGPADNSEDIRIDAEPVLTQQSINLVAGTPEPETPQIVCQIQVPTLNVRSGPGLEYLVVAQVSQTDESGGEVPVVGRTDSGDWLAVQEDVAPGGWIINQARFVVCNGDATQLPVAEISDGRLAPTPEPVVAATPTPAGEAPTEAPQGTPEEPVPELPPGKALLIVHNAFDHDIRFTLSPDEYDLKPGESVQIQVDAGQIRFTASSPFRSSSGNAEFPIEEGTVRDLYIYFVPSEGDANHWDLRY